MLKNKGLVAVGVIVIGAVFYLFPSISFAATTTLRVAAGADDVFIWQSGSFFSTSSIAFDVGLVNNFKNEAAARFTNVNIPQGSTINTAYLSITSRGNQVATTVNSYLGAEATNSASRIISYADYWARPLTATTVWNNIPAWTASTTYNSPDISAAIREVINRAGWVSGNAINIFWKDNGSTNGRVRTGASWDNNTYAEPSLTINYTLDTTPPVRSNPSPATGFIFSIGTTQATIGLTTNENATCRYSGIAGTPYSSMANFSTTGGTSHSTLIAGLTDGSSYTYYVRCQDIAGNVYEDDNFSISFSVDSAPATPVSGYAWSENIGWISFSGSNYGVNIDDSGNFSGYAWSENIGWISFNPSELAGCPSGTCQAQVNLLNGDVSGWARALSYGGGWDGWIRLRGTNYGVSINTDTGEFSGYAWSDMVAGWISFKGSNYGVIVDSDLFNLPPSSPTYPSPAETWDNCSLQGTSKVTLSWNYSDPENDPQDSYQVLIDNNSNFSSPEIDSCVSPEPNTCLSGNGSQSYTPITNLNWATTYYWKVKVKDDQENWSDWSSSRSFTTPSHAYPWIDFSWAPISPTVQELIQFANQTTYYGGALGQSWAWEFGDGRATSTQNPTHSYLTSGNYQVQLGTCDNSGYCCTGANRQKLLQISPSLPEWKEISPF
jgi:hypothetical protein